MESGNRLYRRNRKHLRLSTPSANRHTEIIEPDDSVPDTYSVPKVPEIVKNSVIPNNQADKVKPSQSKEPPVTRTRSGRVIKAPDKLDMVVRGKRVNFMVVKLLTK